MCHLVRFPYTKEPNRAYELSNGFERWACETTIFHKTRAKQNLVKLILSMILFLDREPVDGDFKTANHRSC